MEVTLYVKREFEIVTDRHEAILLQIKLVWSIAKSITASAIE
jgi:hypothetical protein